MSSQDNNSEKKSHLKEDDIALFRNFCQKVKPLKTNNRIIPKPNRSKKKTAKEKMFYSKSLKHSYRTHQDNQEIFCDSDVFCMDSIEKVASDTVLHYSQPHLHRNLYRQMKRGTLSIGATLDLHQYTANEAVRETAYFLQACQEQNIRWVLMIHGKGSFSKNGAPVLKSLLNKWLRTKPSVLAFHSAQPKDGGTGALYVLLKLKKGK